MKILMGKGARNIAQTAHSHVRNLLLTVNTRSDQSVSNLTKAGEAKTIPVKQEGKTSNGHSKTSRVTANGSDILSPSPGCGNDDSNEDYCRDNQTDNLEDSPERNNSPVTSDTDSVTVDVDVVDNKTSERTGLTTSSDIPQNPDESSRALQPVFRSRLNSFTLNCGSPNHDLKRFLDVVGTDPKEARFWFKHFQKMTTAIPLFAIIQIEEEVLRVSEAVHRPQKGQYDLDKESPLSELCSYLAFLQRHDMKCVIIHGRSLDGGQEEATNQDELQTRIVHDCQLITDLLEKNGAQVRQVGIPPIHATGNNDSGWSISTIDPHHLERAHSLGRIPILSNIALTPERRLVNVDLFDTTTALSLSLLPLKVLIVNIEGGIVDQDNQVIPNINLPHEESAVSKSLWCSTSVKNKIHDISVLLSQLQEEQKRLGKRSDSAVIITSCTTLLTELFTHHGSGTFFKITEKINVYKSIEDVDTERLTNLIEVSFGKTLQEDFIDQLADNIDTIFVSESYAAAAIVTREPGVSVPYLDKFVVRRDHQDNSVGQMLWEQMCHLYPQLFWRSRNVNLINPWYFKRSEGSWSDGEWTVFWYGIHKHHQTSALIDCALSKSISFKAPAPLRAVNPPKGGTTSSKWSALKYM